MVSEYHLQAVMNCRFEVGPQCSCGSGATQQTAFAAQLWSNKFVIQVIVFNSCYIRITSISRKLPNDHLRPAYEFC